MRRMAVSAVQTPSFRAKMALRRMAKMAMLQRESDLQ